MKKLIFLLMMCFVSMLTFAQDSTGTGNGAGGALPAKVTFWITIAIGAYELIVRYFPTVNSWSIITWVMRLFKWLVPDKSTTKGNHE